MDKQLRDLTSRLISPKEFPVRTGDTVRVHIRIKEGSKERVQIFEGVVLKVQGHKPLRSFTVRKISDGVGVEKTLLFSSPNLANVEVLSRFKIRRARLFYLRKLKGRAARLDYVKVEKN